MKKLIRVCRKFQSISSGHQKLRIFELILLMIVGGLLETVSVSLILPFVNGVMDPEGLMEQRYVKWVCGMFGVTSGRTFLVILAFFLAAAYILKNVYLLLEYNVQYRFVYGNMLAMQEKVLDNILHRPYSFFRGSSSGEIVRVVNNDVFQSFDLLIVLLSLFTELVVSGMLIITIFVISPYVTLAIAAILLIMVFLIDRRLRPLLRKAGQDNQAAAAGMNKWLLQSIQGIKELKVMRKESFFQENYDRCGNVYIGAMRKDRVWEMVPRFLIEAVSMSAMFFAVGYLIWRGADVEEIVPMLSAVAMAALRLLPSINRISGAMANISYREPMLDKLIQNLADMDESGGAAGIRPKGRRAADGKTAEIARMKRELDFHEITFRYPDAEEDVLTGAGMTIRRGETVGLIGSSGAGKTTAADIILGLLAPDKGGVLVDGVDIREDMEGWLDQVGYIPQTIFMLDDSIRNNVAFGEKPEDISEEGVWHALKEASLADFVAALPHGLDTQIGELGVRLSGGQRQRIGIARALYRDPAVLVFDEATSALDNETESAIMESINALQGKKTMIIIAHRLTTIERCDHIFRVEHGRIVKVR